MKKLTALFLLIAFGCNPYDDNFLVTGTRTSLRTLSDTDCLYVVKDTRGQELTFYAPCNKFKIGDRVELKLISE